MPRMKKIGRDVAVKTFELCDKSETGLKWKVNNTSANARGGIRGGRRGDPVKWGERWLKGSIPVGDIKSILASVKDEHETESKRDKRLEAIRQAQKKQDEIRSDEEKKRAKIATAINSRYVLSEDGKSLECLRGGFIYEEGDAMDTPYLCFCGCFIENSQVVKFLQTGEFPEIYYEMEEGERWRDVSPELNKEFYEARSLARESEKIKELRQRIADLEAEVSRLKGTNS